MNQQTQKIYEHMLDLLEELIHITPEDSEEEGAEDATDADVDLVDGIVEDAVERGIEEDSAERVFRAVAALAKKAREG